MLARATQQSPQAKTIILGSFLLQFYNRSPEESPPHSTSQPMQANQSRAASLQDRSRARRSTQWNHRLALSRAAGSSSQSPVRSARRPCCYTGKLLRASGTVSEVAAWNTRLCRSSCIPAVECHSRSSHHPTGTSRRCGSLFTRLRASPSPSFAL